jgi:hypothetical protein
MGARSNLVFLSQDHPPFFVYSRWRGRELRGILDRALRASEHLGGRCRWSDASTLAALAFRFLLEDEPDLLGVHIGTTHCLPDFDIPELRVDVTRGVIEEVEVTFGEHGIVEATLREWSFAEFLERDRVPVRA